MASVNELEKIKEEMLAAIGAGSQPQRGWSSSAVTIVLVVLALVSVFQLFQSASILSRIKNGAIKPAAASSATLPDNLQNLPNMVGGC